MAADVIIDPINGQIYWNDNAGVGTESISIKGDAANTISFYGYGSAYSPGSTPSGTARVTINDSITGTLVPGSTGFELGSSAYRWNTYTSFISLNDFNFSGSGSSFDISNASAIGQTLNFFNSGTQLQFNFGVGASLASTATFFGSVNSNRMILNVNSSGNVYLQTNQTNARVRLFQNNLTGNVSIFGINGGNLFLGEDTTTNNADIGIRGTVLNGGGGDTRAALFTIATATSNGTGMGGTIQFQTSTSRSLTGTTPNTLRTRLRIEGAATGTSNLESVIILGDASSGTAWTSYLRGVDASGTDIEAGELQIQAGRSTGTGVARGISLYVSQSAIATSTFINTASQIARFTGTGLTIYSTTGSASTTSGALIVAGGAAVGQTLSVGGSLNIFNGANFTGFRFTGTANTTYTLPIRTPTGTGTSYLSSGIDGTMAWVAAPTGGSATPGGADTAIQFNDGGSAFGGTSGGFSFTKSTHTVTIGSLTDHTGLTSIGLQLYNNNASSSSPTQRWSPALEFMGRSWTPSTSTDYRVRFLNEVQTSTTTYGQKLIWKFSYDTGTASYTNPLMALHSQFGVGIGASNQTAFSYFKAGNQSSTDLTYTLPTGYPTGTGTSFLSASTGGIMAWVAAPSGSGSGSVNSGTANYAAYYASTGTAVDSNANLQFTGSGVSIGGNISSTTPTTGSLKVFGGAGITGNAFIGGTTTITDTTESFTTTSGSLVVSGGAGIAKSLFVGTTLSVGQAPGYVVPNNLASFVSTVNSYNQVVIQNKSSGASASADFVLNNDQSTDSAWYGNLGMNSSGWAATTSAFNTANAVYLTSTSSPLVLGSTTQHPIRFAVNSGVSDVLFIDGAGTAISVLTNFDLRNANKARFFNTGSSLFTSIAAGNISVSYDLLLPTAKVGAGSSVIITDSNGQMFFAASGSGIAFSAFAANTPVIRAKRPLSLQFASGFTPLAAGADNVVIRVPDSPTDGTTQLTYVPREFYIRVETPSAGSSRIQLERSTGTGAFTLAATGSSYLGGLGLTISGAGIYVTSTTTFAGAFITSGDNLRLNWTLLNATHANFSVQLLLEEV